MNNLFDQILDKNEQIIKVLKPNKFKYTITSVLWGLICSVFFVLPFFGPDLTTGMVIALILITAIYLLIWTLFAVLRYKKTFYGYTNKRIVIRTGIIGVDFKSLDMKMIGAIDVYVSFLDKILRKNTGTIRFGSMSSPINNQNSTYMLNNIESPYDLYKEIKEVIDDCKESKEIKNN